IDALCGLKLKENYSWFADLLLRFKPPNQKSKEALNSKKLKIGSHKLTIQPIKLFRLAPT
ncbi:hypothetical protein HN51_067833, partial [Arachis hypogaea]